MVTNTNGVTVNTMFSSADDMTFHNIGTPLFQITN